MSGSFEKSVKGGTKIKASRRPFTARESISLISWKQLAPPKAKYVEHILVATHAGDAGVAEIFRALQNRLRDSTWTIVFKALIIVHLMIREGEPNVTLKYLADSPSKLAISNFSDGTSKQYNMVAARGPTERGSRHLCCYRALMPSRRLSWKCADQSWESSSDPRNEHPALLQIYLSTS